MCGSRGVGWGGRGLGSGPDPVPGKSQVLSNSIEISIWTPPPPLNSWTPRIPGKFWTKKTQNNHKKSRLFSRRWAWTPPPPPPFSDKKIWICACIDHSTAHPGLTQCQKELYGYVCTLAELSTNHRGPHRGGGGGGGGKGVRNKLACSPKIENLFSWVPCSPTFSLFACSPQKFHLPPLFP